MLANLDNPKVDLLRVKGKTPIASRAPHLKLVLLLLGLQFRHIHTPRHPIPRPLLVLVEHLLDDQWQFDLVLFFVVGHEGDLEVRGLEGLEDFVGGVHEELVFVLLWDFGLAADLQPGLVPDPDCPLGQHSHMARREHQLPIPLKLQSRFRAEPNKFQLHAPLRIIKQHKQHRRIQPGLPGTKLHMQQCKPLALNNAPGRKHPKNTLPIFRNRE
jgi:hypothetical protein